MYTIYVEGHTLVFSNVLPVETECEVLLVPPGEVISSTKLLQKVQFTKHLQVISEQAEQLFARFCADFPNIQAAGGLTYNEKGEVLMILRYGRWDLPKGKREKGEPITACALREVEEECDLQGLELGELLTHTYHCYQIEGHWVLKKTTWYRMLYRGLKSPTPQEQEGITAACFVPPGELEAKLAHTYQTIRDVFAANARI